MKKKEIIGEKDATGKYVQIYKNGIDISTLSQRNSATA